VFCFYISGFTLLSVYLYLVFFYLAAYKRHYAFRLTIALEFFYCSYMCLFYVLWVAEIKYVYMYVSKSNKMAYILTVSG